MFLICLSALTMYMLIVIGVICGAWCNDKERKKKKRNQRIRDPRINQNALEMSWIISVMSWMISEMSRMMSEMSWMISEWSRWISETRQCITETSRIKYQAESNPVIQIFSWSNPGVTSGHDNPAMSTEPASVSTDPMKSQPTAPQDEQQPPPTYAEVHNYPVLSPWTAGSHLRGMLFLLVWRL